MSGSTVEVQVTATNSAGSAVASSTPTAVVTASGTAPLNTALPTIAGSAVEAHTLAATSGTWTGSPTPIFSYQWQDCNASGTGCQPIAGATGPGYALVSSDVGFTLEVVVTATNGFGTVSATSTQTAVVTSAAGPLTPLLDSFNRPDGALGASWLNLPAFSSPSTNNLTISAQQVTSPTGESGDYWNTPYGPNSEVWATVAAKPTANNDLVTLGLRYQSPGSATSSGYQAAFINVSSGTDQYKIWLRTNGQTSAVLASATGPELSAGDQLLFRAIGTTLELWRDSAGKWTKLLTATDGTITSGGYLALITRDGAVRLDNFGGGTLP